MTNEVLSKSDYEALAESFANEKLEVEQVVYILKERRYYGVPKKEKYFWKKLESGDIERFKKEADLTTWSEI